MTTGLYTAYPIDQAGIDHMLVGLIQMAQDEAQIAGFGLLYDPGDAFQVTAGTEPTAAINKVNMAAILAMDAVVAFLPKGVASVGVPREIEFALQRGKAVLVVTDHPSWALPYSEPRARVRLLQEGMRGWEQVADDLRWLSGEAQSAVQVPEDGPDLLRFRRDRPQIAAQDGGIDVQPRRAYEDDAGFDLIVSERTFIPAGQFRDIPCGVAVELPNWTWGYLTGRSSTLRKRNLLVNPGVIDCGYRGPLFAGVFNLGDKSVTVEPGERIAQLIVLPNATRAMELQEVAELGDHPRGQAGFGSSGV